MPDDNAATVAPGTAVDFPQDGVINGTSISRISADSFNLADIGTYQIFFQVSVTEAAQLQLTLNGVALDYTTVGRTTGTDQIVGMYLINTTTENSVLTVQNPTGNTEAITITPSAGGTQAVSAHLVITNYTDYMFSPKALLSVNEPTALNWCLSPTLLWYTHPTLVDTHFPLNNRLGTVLILYHRISSP